MAAPLLVAKNQKTDLVLLPSLAGREIIRGVLGSILGKRR